MRALSKWSSSHLRPQIMNSLKRLNKLAGSILSMLTITSQTTNSVYYTARHLMENPTSSKANASTKMECSQLSIPTWINIMRSLTMGKSRIMDYSQIHRVKTHKTMWSFASSKDSILRMPWETSKIGALSVWQISFWNFRLSRCGPGNKLGNFCNRLSTKKC